MNAEIAASAHCAKTLSRLSVGYRKMAVEFPRHRKRYAAEAVRLRSEARWHLDRARRMKEQATS
jgi:hypothetical protein